MRNICQCNNRRRRRSSSQKGGRKHFVCKKGPLYIKTHNYSDKKACSPANKKEYKNGETCYSHEALEIIAKAWNKSYPYNVINTKQSKKELWKDIKSKMDNCDSEWCWLDQPFIKRLQTDKILRQTFKPPIPKEKWQWLTTDDIEFVCHQYEDVEPTFKFLGAFPIDFSRVYHYIFGKFNVNDYMSDGYHKIGVVFNEDPHDQSGSHWIGLFLNLKTKNAYFFDSYGEPPHERVAEWVKKLTPEFKLTYNRTEHQRENSECGVYCIHFIVRMALGVPFKTIEQDIIHDCEINSKRIEYFNPFQSVDKYW
jgi:hypothetical protein